MNINRPPKAPREGLQEAVETGKRNRDAGAAAGHAAERELLAALREETGPQESAAELEDRRQLWRVRLNLVKQEIAAAEKQGASQESLANLRKREEALTQELLQMSEGPAN